MRQHEPDEADDYGNLSGSLLAAHPSMQDPNFSRAVILLSAHSEEEGAFGVVINRPTGKTLGEVNGDFAYGPLANVPVYSGGPVNSDQMLLAAWQWDKDGGSFKLYFGISEEKARDFVREHPDVEVRGFLGYSGWTEGQIEGELAANAWVVSPIVDDIIAAQDEEDIWRSILSRVRPELLFLADLPDDPSRN